jgi:hypothetical protein
VLITSNVLSVCLVHGLNGHAFNTFASNPSKDHRQIKMMARDILPSTLDRATYYGRYMTFGYLANVIDADNIPHTFEEGASKLLDQLLQDRPLVSNFVEPCEYYLIC